MSNMGAKNRTWLAELLCEGYIILAGLNSARLVPRPHRTPRTESYDVPFGLIDEMIKNHELGEISEDGFPPTPERKAGQGYKTGWKEAGLPKPMEGQAYYLMIQ
jgi:hypothetical protein